MLTEKQDRDAFHIMNAICKWPNPPNYDERWGKKIGALCEYVAICRELTNIKSAKKKAEIKKQLKEFEKNLGVFQ